MNPAVDASVFWTQAGVWIAVAGAVLMLLNAVRAIRDAPAFATYLGLPLASDAGEGFVHVYAARAAFIGLLIVAFLALRDTRALGVLALTAVLMPVADAVLTHRAGARPAIVVRHAVIAAVLILAGILLLGLMS